MEGMEGTAEAQDKEGLCDDVLLGVFSQLGARELAQASQSCRRWSGLANSEELWERLYVADAVRDRAPSRLSSNEMGGSAIQLARGMPQEQVAQAKRLLGGGGWRQLYQRRQELETNWRTGDSDARTLKGHNDLVRCAQLDGDTLVTCCGSWDHSDCSIRVWDMDTGQLRQLLRGHMGPIWCMVHDAARERVVSGSDDYTVRYWDSRTGNCVVLQNPDSAVRCVHMDPDSRMVVAGTEFGRLLMWDAAELDELMSAGMERVTSAYDYERMLSGSPSTLSSGNNAMLDSGGGDSGGDYGGGGSSSGHQRSGSEGNNNGSGHGSGGEDEPPGPSSRRIVVDGPDHVQAMDAQEGEGNAVSAIQVQGGLCASTSMEGDSRVRLWDVSNASAGWRLLRTVGEPRMMFCHSMSFEMRLNRMVAGCGDKNVRVWDLETGTQLHLLQGHTGEVHSHQFDENTVASAGLNGHLLVWDARTGRCVHSLEHSAPMHAFQYHGNRVASGTWDGRVMLWDLRRGQLVKEWEAHAERVWAVCMDEYRIVSAALDRNICVRCFTPERERFVAWGSNGL